MTSPDDVVPARTSSGWWAGPKLGCRTEPPKASTAASGTIPFELFATLTEAQVLTEKHRLWYNHVRPHSAREYQTPAQYAITCMEKPWPSLLRNYGPRLHPRILDTDTNLLTTLP
jgi:hypothetical protein